VFLAVNFHYIREEYNEPYPSIFGVTPEEFENQVDQIGSAVTFLSIQDIIDIIENKKKIPKRSAVITFDDGFKEQYELAWPILKKKGIPAIFFANTKPIEDNFVTITHKIHIIRAYTSSEKLIKVIKDVMGQENIPFSLPSDETATSVYLYDTKEAAKLKYFLNYKLNETEQRLIIDQAFQLLGFNEKKISNNLYMTKEMLVNLASEGVLGTHGHEHRPLGLLKNEVAVTDLHQSVTKLKNWTGRSVKALSFPFGFKKACSMAAADFARENGLKFAFTMERAGNINFKKPFFLARLSNSDIPNTSEKHEIIDFLDNLPVSKWFKNII